MQRESTTLTLLDLDEPTAQTPQESPAQMQRAPAPHAGVGPPPPKTVGWHPVQPVMMVPQVVHPVVMVPQVIMPKLEMDPLCEGCGMADPAACCLATFCPYVAVGEIAEAVGMNPGSACGAYWCMSCCCGPWVADCWHGCSLAQKLRQRHNVNTHENAFVTCLCHSARLNVPYIGGLFCCAFALTQELRFARKVNAQPTVIMAGPVRQMMPTHRM